MDTKIVGELYYVGNSCSRKQSDKWLFPLLLGVLPGLGVLILRHNQLQGAIGKPESNLVFLNLHIADFSYNNITSKLPFEYFQIWKAMQIIGKHDQMYMQANMSFKLLGNSMTSLYT